VQYRWLLGGYWVGGSVWKEARIVSEWKRLYERVPEEIREAARGRAHPEAWRYSEQSLNMMKGMGWNGSRGLGRAGQGIEEPVPVGRPKPKGKEERPAGPVRFVRARRTTNCDAADPTAQIQPAAREEQRGFRALL
jgi:hypothetical protein